MAKQWKDGKIPLHYQVQCHHYMAVCNEDAWYLAVLIYGKEFKFYRIEWNEQLLTDLIQIEKDFWERNVQNRILPDPDGSAIYNDAITKHFKQSKPTYILLPDSFDKKLERWEDLVSSINWMEQEKKRIEQELKIYMGEAETAKSSQFQVSWKPVDSFRVDGKS